MTTPPSLDAEFTRKVALGILSTLQLKGLLTSEEVDAILIAARRSTTETTNMQATDTQASAPAMGASVGAYRAAPRGPLSDPQPGSQTGGPPVGTGTARLAPSATPTRPAAGTAFFNLPPRHTSPDSTSTIPEGSPEKTIAAGADIPATPPSSPWPVAVTSMSAAQSAPTQSAPPPPAPLLPEPAPLVLDSISEAERLAESRWTRKEPLPPPTFDIEL